jgi:transcriptional regulator with XRE-family HTH domain
VNFADRLKQLREDHQLRQEDIGELLGFGKSTVSQWEAGIRVPAHDILERLADHFHVTVDYLLGRTDEPRPRGPFTLPDFVKGLSPKMQTFLEREAAAGWPRIRLLYDADLAGLTASQIEQVLSILVDVKKREEQGEEGASDETRGRETGNHGPRRKV